MIMIRSMLFVCFLYVYVFQASDTDLFLEGLSYQKNLQYQQALSVYRTIDKKTGAVFYNMALCYRMCGQYPQALVCLRVALYRGTYTVSRHAALLLHEIKTAHLPADFIRHPLAAIDYVSYLFFLFDYVSWLPLFSVQFLFVLFVCIFLMIMSSHVRYRLYFRMLMGLITGFASFFLALLMYVKQSDYGVVVVPTCLRVGPSDQFELVVDVPMAAEVSIGMHHQGWIKVSAGTYEGWILKETVVTSGQMNRDVELNERTI